VAFETAEVIPPALFTGLGLVLFGIPAVMTLVGAAIMMLYPLRRRDDQEAMYAQIEAAKALAVAGPPGAGGSEAMASSVDETVAGAD